MLTSNNNNNTGSVSVVLTRTLRGRLAETQNIARGGGG